MSIYKLNLRVCMMVVVFALFSKLSSAQVKFGDNMGDHKVLKDINLDNHNLKDANLIKANAALIGTGTALINSSVGLQVDATDKAVLVTRVADLLNSTSPSIPVANVINGMIVYDLKTNKFYSRQNGSWVLFLNAYNYIDRYLPQQVFGQKTFRSDSGFVAQGTLGSGVIPVTGAGTRMMWYPGKAAFRAGTASATSWENGVTGNYSVAMGNANSAAGASSIAMGTGNTAGGDFSIAMGQSITTNGLNAIGFGVNSYANAPYSVVFGRNSGVSATGTSAFALGSNVFATHPGSFVLGDNSATTMNSAADNRMQLRFAGGYEFYTMGNLSKSFFANTDGVLKYQGDYSAAYDSRSLVDMAYVEARYAPKGPSSESIPISSATGGNSLALGVNSTATGSNSFAYGGNNSVTGNQSMVGGIASTTSGYQAVAMGASATADGLNSIVLGSFVSANGRTGAMVMGDHSTGVSLMASINNEMAVRFSQGIRMYSNSPKTAGSRVNPSDNGWGSLSDKRKKENFEIADAKLFLAKIDTMKLGSWNYKVQDAKKFRHYGPMAQDFYGAFGKDGYGTIGCDTLINAPDFDGVNLIAIKGLVTWTKELMTENESLKASLAALEAADNAMIAAVVEDVLQKRQQAKEKKTADNKRRTLVLQPVER